MQQMSRKLHREEVDNPTSVPAKRQSKKPRKVCASNSVLNFQFSPNEDSPYPYQTRSRNVKYVQPEKDIEESENADATENAENAENIEYCFCGRPENDQMVKCDNENCKYKWFHYECVNITDPNSLPNKWYCPNCREENGN